jgi:hypothetical protein
VAQALIFNHHFKVGKMNKIHELLLKLKALAEKGEGGEQTNAQSKLEEIAIKHDVDLSELDSPNKSNRKFRFKVRHKLLNAQIIRMVCGEKVEIYAYKDRPSIFSVNVTDAEFIEINAIAEFYTKAYERELQLFNHAFIQSNRIFPSDAGSKDPEDLSEEERKYANEVLRRAGSIDKYTYHNQLEG